jgi:ATP-dependent helicase HrpA
VREQRQSLLFPGFVADIGATRLRELPRYLAAAAARLDALPGSAPRDQKGMDVLDRVYAGYERMLAGLPEERQHTPEVDAIHWMIEELRVSLFAQTLGTPIPVSEKRVISAMEKVR